MKTFFKRTTWRGKKIPTWKKASRTAPKQRQTMKEKKKN